MALSGSTRGAGPCPDLSHQQESGGWGSATPVLVVLQQPLAIGPVPTRMAPSRRLPSPSGHQLLVDAADPVQQQQLLGAGGAARGRRRWEPTSTPSA